MTGPMDGGLGFVLDFLFVLPVYGAVGLIFGVPVALCTDAKTGFYAGVGAVAALKVGMILLDNYSFRKR
jgi:hypothetical protein